MRIRFRWALPIFHLATNLAAPIYFSAAIPRARYLGLTFQPAIDLRSLRTAAYFQENQPGATFDLRNCYDCHPPSPPARFIAFSTPPAALIAFLAFPEEFPFVGERWGGLKWLAVFELLAIPFWWRIGELTDRRKAMERWCYTFATVQLIGLALLPFYWQFGYIFQFFFWIAAGARGFWIAASGIAKAIAAKSR
jgi:hypothetical protein